MLRIRSPRHHLTSPLALLALAVAAAPLVATSSPGCASGETTSEGGGSPTTSWTTGSGAGGSGGQPQGGGGSTTGTPTGTATGTGGSGASGGEGGAGNAGGAGGEGGSGNTGGSGGSGGEGGSGGSGSTYSHTIEIGNTFDFDAAEWDGMEAFATTSTSYHAFFAWDATYFYVGLHADGQDDDIGNPSGVQLSSKWVLLYFGGGSPSTTTAAPYNHQTPTLPFASHYGVRWRADGNSSAAMIFDGSNWVTSNSWPSNNDIHLNTSATIADRWLEMRVARTVFGSPTTVNVHLSMINELSSYEWTWAGVPSNSFTDGYQVDYGHYFAFDLSGAATPTSHSPQ